MPHQGHIPDVIGFVDFHRRKTPLRRWRNVDLITGGLDSVARALRNRCGRRGWTRTSDPQLRRLMLYPPELRARIFDPSIGTTSAFRHPNLYGFGGAQSTVLDGVLMLLLTT